MTTRGECVLAIDLGTGGPKVALVAADGRTVAWRSRPVTTTFVAEGGAEQDPHEMWSAVVAATRDTFAAVGGAPPPILAVAVTSQYMSTVPVDRQGMPTGPAILWMDTRGGPTNLGLLTDESFMLFLERNGLIPLPSGNDGLGHVHVLREQHPDAYAAASAFVEPMDYLNARLTGRVCATQSTAYGLHICDNRTWGATTYDPDLVAAAGLDPDKLAPLVPLQGVIGTVTAAAAAELGIPADVPVLTGTIDSITSAVGTGALDPTQAAVVIGTTSVLVTHIGEHRNDLGAALLAVPSPLPQMYFVMAENGLGGRALEWAMRLYGYGDDFAGALADADAIAPGAAGVQFLPWLAGSIAPSPNDDVRAAYVGLSQLHDRRHALRATVEGVALNLAWLLPAVESFTGNSYPFLRFGGGGAQSPLVAQVLADACDRPVHRLAEPRATNARGAAFLAFAELGMLDLADVPGLLDVAAVHDPDAASRPAMQVGLRRLAALHPALALAATQQADQP